MTNYHLKMEFKSYLKNEKNIILNIFKVSLSNSFSIKLYISHKIFNVTILCIVLIHLPLLLVVLILEFYHKFQCL